MMASLGSARTGSAGQRAGLVTMATAPVPTLDEIAADPTRAADLPSETRRALTLRALAVIGVLAVVEAPADDRGRPNVRTPLPSEDEYLSIRSLARRIPYDEQTIRNFISQGVFRRDVHYVKLQGKGRPVFKWSAVRAWLEGRPCPAPPTTRHLLPPT
jgi:hypothetical protein